MFRHLFLFTGFMGFCLLAFLSTDQALAESAIAEGTIAEGTMAQSTIELSCRAQAKEVAVQTYQDCVTQARTQRIQEIRKEYQAKLSDLKSTYDQELKNLAGEKATSKIKSHKAHIKTKVKNLLQNSEKSKAGNRLPEKLIPTKKLPIRQPEETNTVVLVPQETPEGAQSPESNQDRDEPQSEPENSNSY
jgi:hypothetical protein